MEKIDLSLLGNSVWNSLSSEHRHLGIHHGGASRYIPEVSPFAALREGTIENLRDLAKIVSPKESILIRGNIPKLEDDWILERHILSMQYILPLEAAVESFHGLIKLTDEHVPDILELTQLVLPGFFQRRSLEMGPFFGIYVGKRLAAVTGVRIYPKPFKEITAVCTHPEYQGRGFAAKLVKHVSALIRSEGNIPFLHVTESNLRARELYQRLGFQQHAQTQIFGLRREEHAISVY
jgi:ribosomal protein S18 acetylase RimI-like enzyme